MYSQMQFVRNKSLGFEKENKLTLSVKGAENILKIPVFSNALKQQSNIYNVSVSRNHFGRSMSFEQAEFENNSGNFETHCYSCFYIDEEFVATLGINIGLAVAFVTIFWPVLQNSACQSRRSTEV